MMKFEKPDGTHWILASANSNWEWFGGSGFAKKADGTPPKLEDSS